MALRYLLFGLLALGCGPASAFEVYPDRPITFVVPFSPGGGNDVTARLLAPFVEQHLGGGARLDVVNKPGAGGETGFAYIANADPDGYTIGMIATPNVLTIPIERQARYSLGGFDPLLCLVSDPGVWAVRADSPYRSVTDAVAEAAARPHSVTVGSTGVGSRDHLAILWMHSVTNARFLHVPFPGGATGDKALEAGRIAVAGMSLGEALRSTSMPGLRILGIGTRTRLPEAPDVPTFREQGFDLVMRSLRGVAAPAGLPADVRERLIRALVMAAEDPLFVAKSNEVHNPLSLLRSAEYAAQLREMDSDFRLLWKVSPWVK